MATSILRAAYLHAKVICLYNLHGYSKETEVIVDELKSLYLPISAATALTYNIVFFSIVNYVLFRIAGFSDEFMQFLVFYVTFPGVVVSLIYYCYRFGYQEILLNHSFTSVSTYMHNFGLVLGMSVAPLCLSLFCCLAAVRYFEPFLPEYMQTGFYFPTETWERSLKEQVYFEWGLGSILLLSTPVWNRGYHVNLQLLGRKGKMANAETALEIIFCTFQTYTLHFLYTPIIVILRNNGVVFHPVHILVTLVEMAFLNHVINIKFFTLHKLEHECIPFYRMTHLEHHICKGIYVTNAGVGIWEALALGGTPGICFVSLLSIPYAMFQGLYLGLNFVAHAMTPWPKWTQWHILHHTVLSDIYGSNIPTSEDKARSRTYAKYGEKLKGISPFIKHEWFSDAVSILFIIIFGLFMHFGLETGVLKIINTIQWSA